MNTEHLRHLNEISKHIIISNGLVNCEYNDKRFLVNVEDGVALAALNLDNFEEFYSNHFVSSKFINDLFEFVVYCDLIFQDSPSNTINPHFPALRSVPMAVSEGSRQKQIPSSHITVRHLTPKCFNCSCFLSLSLGEPE